MTPPDRDQVPRAKGEVAWERPTLTLLGDVKDLIHASGKGSDQGDSDGREPAQGSPHRLMGRSGPSSSIAPRLEIVALAEPLEPLGAEQRARHDVARCGGGGRRALRTSGERYWMDLPGLATFCFDERSDHVVAAPQPGIAADAVAELYWHAALPLVVQARGGEVLHASGVLMPRGVVAFCGRLDEREVHHRLRSPPAWLPACGPTMPSPSR